MWVIEMKKSKQNVLNNELKTDRLKVSPFVTQM